MLGTVAWLSTPLPGGAPLGLGTRAWRKEMSWQAREVGSGATGHWPLKSSTAPGGPQRATWGRCAHTAPARLHTRGRNCPVLTLYGRKGPGKGLRPRNACRTGLADQVRVVVMSVALEPAAWVQTAASQVQTVGTQASYPTALRFGFHVNENGGDDTVTCISHCLCKGSRS